MMEAEVNMKAVGTGAGFSVAERYLTKAEVAALLQVSRRTVDNLMRRGWLVYHKIGRTVRFRKADLDEHLNETARVCRHGGRR